MSHHEQFNRIEGLMLVYNLAQSGRKYVADVIELSADNNTYEVGKVCGNNMQELITNIEELNRSYVVIHALNPKWNASFNLCFGKSLIVFPNGGHAPHVYELHEDSSYIHKRVTDMARYAKKMKQGKWAAYVVAQYDKCGDLPGAICREDLVQYWKLERSSHHFAPAV